MIKGAQKKMIVMKTADSPIFEEAYFVLRREKKAEDSDIVAEANRIIGNCDKKRGVKVKNELQILGWGIGCFLCGAVSGGCFAVALLFI